MGIHKKTLHLTYLSKALPIMRKTTIFLLGQTLLGLLFYQGTIAQTCGEYQLTEIRKKYVIGKFNELTQDVNACLENGFSDNKQKEEALAILAKTYIEINEIDSAALHIDNLLLINPNYEAASGDPGIFKKLINDLKLATIAQTVTSVSKKAENVKEAPATVLVITEKDIKERGYTDIEQIFSDLPGFDISRTYGITYSNIYQRGYRSENTDRTLLLVDGVEDNDLWSGGIYLARQYPVTNIKRIEVVYGPASTMYGANAFLGVINIVTKDKQSFRSDTFISASADFGYGTYNTKYADITLMLRKNNISGSFTVRRFYSDEMDLSSYPEFNYKPEDYDNVDYLTTLTDTNSAAKFVRNNASHSKFNEYFNFMTNDNGDTIKVTPTEAAIAKARELDKQAMDDSVNGHPIEYSNLTDHLYIYGKLKVSDFTIGVHSWQSKNGTVNYYHDNRRASPKNGSIWEPKQTFIYAKYEKEINSALSVQNLAQYKVSEVGDESKTVRLYNYSNKRIGNAELLGDTPSEWKAFYSSIISKQFRNEFKINYSPISRLNIVSGMELRNSIIQGDYRSYGGENGSVIELGKAGGDALAGGNDYHIFDLGGYLQGTYEILPYMKLTLGGRYDYNRIRVTSGYGSQVSPRAALVLTPNKFIIKAIYAQAFQNASIFKKNATTTTRATNPDLAPETASNLELSFGYNISKNTFLDVVYYRANYNSVAVLKEFSDPDDPEKTQQFQAVGELQVQGIQANISGKWRFLNYFANYTFTDPQNKNVENKNEFERVADIADHRLNFGIGTTFFNHLSMFIKTNYIGERPVGEGTTTPNNPGSFPSTAIFTGSLSYNNIIPGLSLQIVGNNLLNKEYFDPGIRSADGSVNSPSNKSSYAYRIPQRRRNFIVRLMYDF